MRALFVTVALILAIPRRSTAEINMADAIEWVTADSDLVVVGTVAKTTPQTMGAETWSRVTIAVSQTIKGSAAKTIDIVVRGRDHKLSGERLWFLTTSERRAKRDGDQPTKPGYAIAPFSIRAGRWGDGDTYALDGSAQMFTIDHQVIGKRADLIAKATAAASSKATQAFQLDLPLDSPAGKVLYGGSAVWLYVPIDAALERSAIAWIASTNANTREQGVEALSNFQSAANIERLTKLLVDPATHDVTEGDKPTVRRYFVRKRAHEVLRRWGVPHTTPPLETAKP
jgi:hypothetical protein